MRSRTQPLAFVVPVDNYINQPMVIAAFTVDVNGNESPDGDAPIRKDWIYGADSTGLGFQRFADLLTTMPNYPNARGQKVSDFLGNHVSVKMYGAVGDGATDDTAAIQAAIDDWRPTMGSVPATLIFPAGSYRSPTPSRGSAVVPGWRLSHRAVGQPETYPRLLWAGPAGTADFLVTEKIGDSIGMQTVKRLTFCALDPSGGQDRVT